MHIAYLVSRYPEVSETFIAREMQQLVNMGHEMTIAQLRWTWPWLRSRGLRVSDAQVLPSQFSPWSWLRGIVWAAAQRPAELTTIWHEFMLTLAGCDRRNRLKLISILLTTLRQAQCLEHRGVEHVRNRFLFGGAIGTMWLARLLRAPYSLTVSTAWMTFPHDITQKVVRGAAFCVVPTQEARQLVVALRGSDRGVHLIRTGVDLNDLTPRSGRTHSDTTPLILAVGRLMKQKGFDVLIRACALLKARGISYTCRVIGSGPEYDALSGLIAELGLGAQVSLVGALPFEGVKSHFHAATVLAMPSRITTHGRDGLPNVVAEALAVGVPVVASAVTAIPDLIIDQQTGLLVAPEDAAQLAQALLRMLTDEALRARLTQAGYAKVQREYDIVATVRQLECLIQSHAQPYCSAYIHEEEHA
jgi:glycosyltransferase involved in cell wall biosynthesis